MKKIGLFFLVSIFNFYLFANVDSLKNVLENSSSKSSKIEILFQIGEFFQTENPEKGILYYEEILRLTKNKKNRANAIHKIGVSHFYLSEYGSALENIQKAAKIREEIKDESSLINSYVVLSTLYRINSHYDTAFKYAQKALKIAEKLHDETMILNVYNALANINYELLEFSAAAEIYERCLALAEKNEAKPQISNALTNLAAVYDEQGKYDLALECYSRSLKIDEESNNKSDIATNLTNIASTYISLKNYDLALNYLEKSNEIAEVIGEKLTITYNLYNIGEIYLKLDKKAEAKKVLFKAAKIAEELKHIKLIGEIYDKISHYYEVKKDYKKAFYYIRLSDEYLMKYQELGEDDIKKQFEIDRNFAEQENRIHLMNQQKEVDDTKHKIVVIFILVSSFIVILSYYLMYRMKSNMNKILTIQIEDRTFDLKKKIEEVEKANKTLAEEMRMRKKMEKQLMFSERMSGIGKFASGVAHEIRNPLAVISSTAQYIQSELSKNSEITEMIDTIIYSTKRASSTIQTLLDFSKNNQSDFEDNDISEVLEKVFQMIEVICKSQKIEVEKEISPSLPIILLDFIKIEGMLYNVVINAIDAMPNGGKLKVKASAKNERIILEIIDNGVGIATDKLSNIFEPFYTTKENGTGLGLSLVYQIMEAHNGKIEVESKIGKGSKFTMIFPIDGKI